MQRCGPLPKLGLPGNLGFIVSTPPPKQRPSRLFRRHRDGGTGVSLVRYWTNANRVLAHPASEWLRGVVLELTPDGQARRFLKAYEALLIEFATDYEQIKHTNIDTAVLGTFFDDHLLKSVVSLISRVRFRGPAWSVDVIVLCAG